MRASKADTYALTRARKAKNAWYWRVSFKRRGKDYFRTFPDLKHGGEHRSRAAALAWRDRQLERAAAKSSCGSSCRRGA